MAKFIKTLIYNEYRNGSTRFRELYGAIKNKMTGSPYGVKSRGEFLCLDYIQAAYECEFIDGVMDDVDTVIEIGRVMATCHAILSNFEVSNYYIVDLPFMLGISKEYLKQVLDPALYGKVHFVSNEDYAGADFALGQTLVVNIDSMGEMPVPVIDAYMEFIDERAAYFYCNNTLGKYDAASIGELSTNKPDLPAAVASGKMPGVIDIFDDSVLEDRISCSFVERYRPSSRWNARAQALTRVYPHYSHVMYKKSDR